jgi:hypothetical protein
MISVPQPSSDLTEKLPPSDLTLDAIPTILRATPPRSLGDRSECSVSWDRRWMNWGGVGNSVDVLIGMTTGHPPLGAR